MSQKDLIEVVLLALLGDRREQGLPNVMIHWGHPVAGWPCPLVKVRQKD